MQLRNWQQTLFNRGGFMKKLILICASFIFLSVPILSSAHPGNTASDGCHYCRTNCTSWGVGWNVRHCHNGKESFKVEKKMDENEIKAKINTIRIQYKNNLRQKIKDIPYNLDPETIDPKFIEMFNEYEILNGKIENPYIKK